MSGGIEEIAGATQQDILGSIQRQIAMENQPPTVDSHNQYNPYEMPDFNFKRDLLTNDYPVMLLGKEVDGRYTGLDYLDVSREAKDFLYNLIVYALSKSSLLYNLQNFKQASRILSEFRMIQIVGYERLPMEDRENMLFNQVIGLIETDFEGNLTRSIGDDRERKLIERVMAEYHHSINDHGTLNDYDQGQQSLISKLLPGKKNRREF